MALENISVIGAGTMGNGIAHVFAQNGFNVILVDVNSGQLERAMQTIHKNLDRQIAKGTLTEEDKKKTLANLTIQTNIAIGVSQADLVVEAATENIELKLQIFQQLDANAPKAAILASNTSSISITKIAAVTNRPDKVIGMHFMNPVPVMKLVEVINGYATTKNVTDSIVALSKQLGKVPCIVNDYPGFIANRILMPMINEAIYSLYEGVAEVGSDRYGNETGYGPSYGSIAMADFIGLDVCLSILNVLHDGFGNPKYAPCPLLVNMVAAGKLGVKNSEGFYQYTPGSKEIIVSERFKK